MTIVILTICTMQAHFLLGGLALAHSQHTDFTAVWCKPELLRDQKLLIFLEFVAVVAFGTSTSQRGRANIATDNINERRRKDNGQFLLHIMPNCLFSSSSEEALEDQSNRFVSHQSALFSLYVCTAGKAKAMTLKKRKAFSSSHWSPIGCYNQADRFQALIQSNCCNI